MIVGSNPTGMFISCEYCVLSGIGVCDGPIPGPEDSYRVWRVLVSKTQKRGSYARIGGCCATRKNGPYTRKLDFIADLIITISEKVIIMD